MPPEQERGIADQRSDIYAIGALLFHVLHGRSPKTPAPADVPTWADRIPAALTAIVTKAMAADPGDRYQSARDLAEDLRRFLSGNLVQAHRYSFGDLLRRWARLNKKVLVSVGGASLAVVVILITSGVRVLNERDRADERANDLVLAQARNAVVADPTTAMRWLRSYRGADRVAACDLATEATARGIASHVMSQHDGSVRRLEARGRDSFMSLSIDATLREWTVEDSAASSRVIVQSLGDAFDYQPNGSRLLYAAGAAKLDILLRDASGRERVLVPGVLPPRGLELSEDGRRALVYTQGGALLLVDVEHPGVPVILHGEETVLRGAAFVAADGTVASFTADGTIRLWSADTGSAVSTRVMAPIRMVEEMSDGFVVLHENGVVSMLGRGLAIRKTIAVPAGCNKIAAAGRGRFIGLACQQQFIVVSVADGRTVYQDGWPRPSGMISFSSDDVLVAVGSLSGAILVVSTSTWTAVVLRGHKGAVQAGPIFLGERIVSGDEKGGDSCLASSRLSEWQTPS